MSELHEQVNRETRAGSSQLPRSSRPVPSERSDDDAPPRFDRNSDWVASCQGFRLEAAGKRVGVVEEVLVGDDKRPAALLVQGGLLGTKSFIVAVEDVLAVIPRSRRIVVQSNPPATRS
jgi:hypothetical protein